MEGAWVIGLLYFGIGKDIGVASGILIHLLRILYILILGLIGFVLNIKLKRSVTT
jgi:hypothetical protein